MIKSLDLVFPHGATVEQCERVARYAQRVVMASISEGGMRIKYMPLTAEEEKQRGLEFDEDAMRFTFGYTRTGM
jgi:hypothetical protein